MFVLWDARLTFRLYGGQLLQLFALVIICLRIIRQLICQAGLHRAISLGPKFCITPFKLIVKAVQSTGVLCAQHLKYVFCGRMWKFWYWNTTVLRSEEMKWVWLQKNAAYWQPTNAAKRDRYRDSTRGTENSDLLFHHFKLSINQQYWMLSVELGFGCYRCRESGENNACIFFHLHVILLL